MRKQTHLIIIDPQNDFCNPKGSLFVPGADSDSERLAKFIVKNGRGISEIHCTLDSHQTVHIAHPIFWVDSKGNHPGAFTVITKDDVTSGKWRSYNPKWQARAQAYVDSLAAHGRYVLCIWPPHCRIGSWGHSIVPAVCDALLEWEQNNFGRVNFVAKGSNLFTEHYSGVRADVPDDADLSTQLNTDLIGVIQQADEIAISGQARSHCVTNTIQDIADNFGDENIKKFLLLEDTTSDVPGFEQLGKDFVKNMTKRGMRTIKSTDY